MDMGSTNGTFINGIMIDPDKTFILNSFDTVSLSDLYEIDFNYSALPQETASTPLIEIKAVDKTPTTTKLKTIQPKTTKDPAKLSTKNVDVPKKVLPKRIQKNQSRNRICQIINPFLLLELY